MLRLERANIDSIRLIVHGAVENTVWYLDPEEQFDSDKAYKEGDFVFLGQDLYEVVSYDEDDSEEDSVESISDQEMFARTFFIGFLLTPIAPLIVSKIYNCALLSLYASFGIIIVGTACSLFAWNKFWAEYEED